MFWRVRGRARMRRLVRQPRARAGVCSVQRLADEPAGPPRLAFSVPRSVGSAVTRNRVRRQVRAACTRAEHQFEAGASYMVTVRERPVGGFAELARSLDAALAQLEPLTSQHTAPDGGT